MYVNFLVSKLKAQVGCTQSAADDLAGDHVGEAVAAQEQGQSAIITIRVSARRWADGSMSRWNSMRISHARW